MPDRTDPLDQPALAPLRLGAATLVAVFVGGAIGTLARYLLDTAYPTPPGHFPSTTLVINLSGSLAIGFLAPLISARARPIAVVGFLGGWTTYSALVVDAALLTRGGHTGTAALYLLATVAGGLALVVAGDLCARLVASRTGGDR
jgi:fluoride exporter